MLAAGFFITGCEEDPTDVGVGVQPTDEELGVSKTDTITLEAQSVLVDSVRTDRTEFSLLGSIYDTEFGVSSASVFTSFALSSAEYDFGEEPVLDSVVLMMQYNRYYGDTAAPQTIHVYPLQEKIEDTLYSSNNLFEYDESADYANSYTHHPRPTDSVTIDTNMYAPHVRIPMSDEFGNFLLNAEDTDMENTENFVDFFKGLYITTEQETQPGSGSLVSYKLTGNQSRIRIYYHNQDDTASFDYIVGDATPRTNHYEHNYDLASEEFKQQLIEGDTTLGNEKLYLQTLAGVRVKVRIPELEKTNKDLVVNDAQFIVNTMDNDGYSKPERLYVIGLDEKGDFYELPDVSEGNAYLGGNMRDDGTANFRLSMYVQGLITGSSENNEILLGIPNESTEYRRLKLAGPESENNRLKISLTYTMAD